MLGLFIYENGRYKARRVAQSHNIYYLWRVVKEKYSDSRWYISPLSARQRR